MNSWTRFFLILFSFFLAVVFLLGFMMVINDVVLTNLMTLMIDLAQKQPQRTITLILCLLGLFVAVAVLVVAILSGRLRKTRILTNAIGDIDVGVDAIESIALNAAKASQSGVKSAKARVAPFKGGKLSIYLVVMAFSDVEIPTMMARVQERVKKDIERYTGIEVGDVRIRVSRVEAIAARVER